jgi:hypothetical protein
MFALFLRFFYILPSYSPIIHNRSHSILGFPFFCSIPYFCGSKIFFVELLVSEKTLDRVSANVGEVGWFR